MLLLTVSATHIFNYDSCVTCSLGIIIKNLDGKSTEQSVSTNLLFYFVCEVDNRLKQLYIIMFTQPLQSVLK